MLTGAVQITAVFNVNTTWKCIRHPTVIGIPHKLTSQILMRFIWFTGKSKSFHSQVFHQQLKTHQKKINFGQVYKGSAKAIKQKGRKSCSHWKKLLLRNNNIKLNQSLVAAFYIHLHRWNQMKQLTDWLAHQIKDHSYHHSSHGREPETNLHAGVGIAFFLLNLNKIKQCDRGCLTVPHDATPHINYRKVE